MKSRNYLYLRNSFYIDRFGHFVARNDLSATDSKLVLTVDERGHLIGTNCDMIRLVKTDIVDSHLYITHRSILD